MLFIIFFPIALSETPRGIYYTDYDESLFSNYLDVPIVATSIDGKYGVLGTMRIALIEDGTGKIVFDRRTQVDETTIESVIDAITFFESITDETYDYFISYDLATLKVSGHSTGAALAYSLKILSLGRAYPEGIVLSGEVDEFGNIQKTGGIPLKVEVLINSNKVRGIVVAPGQSEQYVYENIGGKYLGRKMDYKIYSVSKGIEYIEANNINNLN